MLLLLGKKKETDPASVLGAAMMTSSLVWWCSQTDHATARADFINNKGQDGRAAIHNVVDCTPQQKEHGACVVSCLVCTHMRS